MSVSKRVQVFESKIMAVKTQLSSMDNAILSTHSASPLQKECIELARNPQIYQLHERNTTKNIRSINMNINYNNNNNNNKRRVPRTFAPLSRRRRSLRFVGSNDKFILSKTPTTKIRSPMKRNNKFILSKTPTTRKRTTAKITPKKSNQLRTTRKITPKKSNRSKQSQPFSIPPPPPSQCMFLIKYHNVICINVNNICLTK